jgi:hypothetical protein
MPSKRLADMTCHQCLWVKDSNMPSDVGTTIDLSSCSPANRPLLLEAFSAQGVERGFDVTETPVSQTLTFRLEPTWAKVS